MNISIKEPDVVHAFLVRDYDVYHYQLKSSPAIYKFYGRKNKLLYIGKTKKLSRRMREHLTKKTHTKDFIDEVFKVYYYYVEDELNLELLETYTINTQKPKYNISKCYPSMPEYSNSIEQETYESRANSEVVQTLLKKIEELNLDLNFWINKYNQSCYK